MTPKPNNPAPHSDHFDVIIVGAGLSGVGAACLLQERRPGVRFAVLEARERLGGTWDLFRYPGVRSDSDMQTLGFSFRPWESEKSIADGPAILNYIQETAEAHGVERHIRYGHKVLSAAWCSERASWRLEVGLEGGERASFTCGFLFMCSGYYDYDEGHTPRWEDMEAFGGRLVHPQKWPEDLEIEGRVVVIGSGATAVTLVPELAERAAHVTMLQRSPTYIATIPSEDPLALRLRGALSPRLTHGLVRWKNLLHGMYVFNMARWQPEMVKRSLATLTQEALGPAYDPRHFTPRYNPWDQRLCLAPDGDFFAALRSGRASVVTDEIARFTETGLRLASGEHLEADIVVTATGLKLKLLGGVRLSVDGEPVELSQTFAYKGTMYSGVPNLASAFGYTNASWTLKCELIAQFVCRLLSHMDAQGYAVCTPRKPEAGVGERPAIDLSSGYVERARRLLPKQGAKKPWRIYQNYFQDVAALRFGRLEDGVLEFARRS